MQSSNPVLSKRDSFSRAGAAGTVGFDSPPPSASDLQQMYDAPPARRMTLDDVITRTAMTLGMLVLTGTAAWFVIPVENTPSIIIPTMLVGLGLFFFVAFRRAISPPLILAYAAVQGVLLGSVSHLFNTLYDGIVVQAVVATGIVFATTLAIYKTGIIKVTPRFTKIVVIAGFAAIGLMVVNLLASMMGADGGSGLGLRDGSPLSIVFGIAMVCLGALFLVLDFDLVEKGIAQGAPEREAWLAAFGLTVTLIWIYLEILRLLSYFRE